MGNSTTTSITTSTTPRHETKWKNRKGSAWRNLRTTNLLDFLQRTISLVVKIIPEMV